MKNVKKTLLVSALSLGLMVGTVGVAGAATSTDYQQKNAHRVKNVTKPMVMNMNTGTTPVARAQNNYHYNDGHSNMNPQQHQQMHIKQPSQSAQPSITNKSTNMMNGYGHNTNHNYNENHKSNMSENHMSGSRSGHE